MKFVPSRRWLWGAAVFAVVAPLGFVWPATGLLLLLLDLVWLLALAARRRAGLPAGGLQVQREAPAAFSLGRTFDVHYHWRHGRSRAQAVMVREHLPEPLGGADTPVRRLRVPAGKGWWNH